MRRIDYDEIINKKILEKYSQGQGYKTIARDLNLSKSAVFRFLRENNLCRGSAFRTRKYKLNETYFEKIDNEHKAYWLGFIYADGCVSRNTLSFNLKKDESNLLLMQNFLNDIESNTFIKEFEQDAFGAIVQMYAIDINSKKIVQDLIKLGVFPKKSLILKFPTKEQVPKKFLKDFIREYFDGDGGFSIDKNKIYTIRFMGTKEFLEGVQKFFDIQITPKHDKRKENKNIYSLSFGGNLQVIEKGNYMYNNATIYLKRKYELFQNLINSYDKEKIKQHSKYPSLLHQ